MCDKRLCDNCKYADYEYIDAYNCGYWAIGDCNLPKDAPITCEDDFDESCEWDDDWGIEKACPYWIEAVYEDYD